MILKRNRIPAFSAWLAERGAKVLPIERQCELIRFRVGNTVCHIASDGPKGKATFSHAVAAGALTAFLQGLQWRAATPTPRYGIGRSLYEVIRERDGDMCFFCRKPVAPGEGSIEHLVSLADRGPQHQSNLFLAHKSPCNRDAGRLPAPAKVQIAIDAAVSQALLEAGVTPLRRVA